MSWSKVGNWIKDNAGPGAALIGSLLTGNVPGAVAAGVSMVAGATGTDDPAKALTSLQADPASMIRLKELYYANEADIRAHLAEMTRLRLEDDQARHRETQETIRAGDRADDRLVRWTRPLWGWVCIIAAAAYVFLVPDPSPTILTILLTLPWTYAGLRQVGKGVDTVVSGMVKKRT